MLTFASGARLDLAQLADKLFAVEVASLWGGLQQQLKQHLQEDQQQQVLCSAWAHGLMQGRVLRMRMHKCQLRRMFGMGLEAMVWTMPTG